MDRPSRYPYEPLNEEFIRLLGAPLPSAKGFFAGQRASTEEGTASPQDLQTPSGRAIRGRSNSQRRDDTGLPTEKESDEQHTNKTVTSAEQATSSQTRAGSPNQRAMSLRGRQQHQKKSDGGSRQRQQQGKPLECNFCKRLGEKRSFTRTHVLRDPETNAVVCPILREHHCEICGATGDYSHTRSYCPKKPADTFNMAFLKKTPHNSTGKRVK